MPRFGQKKIVFKKVSSKGFSAKKAINTTDAIARKVATATRNFSKKTLH